jgi:hypothetical protein
VLVIVYFVAAGAGFSGFYTKWHLYEGRAKNGIEAMLDGTAHRPFVYRQLLPSSANILERTLPESIKSRIEAQIVGFWQRGTTGPVRSLPPVEVKYAIRYYVVYYLAFLSLFGALFVMRAVCLRVGVNRIGSTLAPLALVSFTPYFLSGGGYFYDFPEWLFFAATVWLAISGWYWLLGPATIFATLNKESFLFFLPTIFPFIRARIGTARAVTLVAFLIMLSGFTHYIAEQPYLGNPGGAIEVHLLQNIQFYPSIHSLFIRETNYGIHFNFSGYSAVTILLAGIVFAEGRKVLAGEVRMHALLALAINIPMFALFCYPGEVRNLSMLLVTTLLLTAESLSEWSSRVFRSGTADGRTDQRDALESVNRNRAD